jgi:hypothetical protein
VIKKLLIFPVVFILSLLQGNAQLSPGTLSKAHSHLEGLSNCTKCHVLGEKVSNDRCLACHTEIQSRVGQNHGYHASPAIKGKPCAGCHSDHHGLNFQLIRFDRSKFDHGLTGFTLDGAHLKKSCDDCHKPTLIKDQKLKKRKNTFLGLERKCNACHEDIHQGTLQENCSVCHTTDGFKPATRFEHNRSAFALAGRHREVACEACHKTTTRDGKQFRQYKGLKFSQCSSCHTDPHQGKFGPKCQDCHSEQSFSQIKGTENFNHSKTSFPLEGKHSKVTCKSCHKSKLTDPVPHKQCRDCHQDYHQGQFTTPEKSPDCSVCHTIEGFSGSLYTLEQHQQSSFPLKGAHLATPCFSCHLKSDKWNFRNIGKRCADCHTDIHKPHISPAYYPESDCRRCHSEASWKGVSFDHTQTRFPLDGSHLNAGCRDCHFGKNPDGSQFQRFAGLSSSCMACHDDVHGGQFMTNGDSQCQRCHTTGKFIPASKFDHDATSFPLDGRHKTLACGKCHQPVKKQDLTYILFKTGKVKCEDCHQ